MFGAWCSIDAPFIAELLAIAGYDWICIDCQHGLIDYHSMVPMLQAMARTTAAPVVRVPGNDPYAIGKALDAGAQVVIVPMVNSREEAARAVEAARYFPVGRRSIGATRGSLFLPGSLEEVNAEVGLLVMIETAEAVERAEEICSTPGIDGIYIGPRDLSACLGVDPLTDSGRARLEAAMGQVVAACAAAGVVPGVHAANGATASRYARMGFRVVNAAMDTVLLRSGATAELSAIRMDAGASRA